WVHSLLGMYERVALRGLRARALINVLDHIRAEDEATHFICIGPINKVLNTLVWHFHSPGGPEGQAHRRRLDDYLQRSADGLRMNGYNSSELWNTAFAIQAIAATGEEGTMPSTLSRAGRFVEGNQVLENTAEYKRYFRHPSGGGWPFSTRDHGWPISDCTAEGLKASLLLQSIGLNQVPPERLDQAVELILSLQTGDGGWATYELTRGPKWLELLNPSDVFARIMIDYSYVECTSACIQALASYGRAAPRLEPRKRQRISRAI